MDEHEFRISMLSPLDHRYYFANKKIFDELAKYFSEDAVVRYNVKVELSLLAHIAPYCGLSDIEIEHAMASTQNIKVEEVLKEEEKTKHNLKAIVNVIKSHVSETLAPYIHLGATSFDISDTAASLRLKDAHNNVVLPLLSKLLENLISIAERHISVTQVGRTHGQFAVPITVGHCFAEYVSRLGNSIIHMEALGAKLEGKLSGAVGAYNAMSLITDDPIGLEKSHIEKLGLIPAEYSNQICAPEPVLRLLLEYNIAFGIIANLADDLRNLQRSEIAELSEFFDPEGQVGSSTMPQKRNPWNSEHIKSLYKVFFPRVISFYMDQISEHQRDLTNSASQRFISEYIAGFCASVNRAISVTTSLTIQHESIEKNLSLAGDSVLAEAVYILLALGGYNNAHRIVQEASFIVLEKNISIPHALEMLKEKYPGIISLIETQLHKRGFATMEQFFSDKFNYTGKAIEKCTRIVATHKSIIERIPRNILD